MTLGDRDPCPAAETLAALVDGRLRGAVHTATLRHVAQCAVCRSIVEHTALLDDDDEPVVIAHRAHRQHKRIAAFSIVAAATVAGILLLHPVTSWVRSYRDRRAIDRLVAAAPTRFRSVEPRLTGGFRWAPLRDETRGRREGSDPEQLKLDGAAGAVLRDRGTDDPSHVAGIAYLLSGHQREAIEEMRRAAKNSPRDARILTDLGGALYTRGAATDDRAALVEALNVTDEALRLDASLPEAHFNRALILERLGRRDDAVAQWRAFLELERDRAWLAEGRRRLGALSAKAAR